MRTLLIIGMLLVYPAFLYPADASLKERIDAKVAVIDKTQTDTIQAEEVKVIINEEIDAEVKPLASSISVDKILVNNITIPRVEIPRVEIPKVYVLRFTFYNQDEVVGNHISFESGQVKAVPVIEKKRHIKVTTGE